MTPAIETESLTKRFRPLRSYRDLISPARRVERTAVSDVSLRIPPGQVFGLLGQNGAGKTTLIRMLTTLLLPTGGTARVAGFDVAQEPHQVRARIGLVSGDERSFYWRLTGRQNLEFFAALQHLPTSITPGRISDLAERLGIAEHLDRPFGHLSTGQRQKLAIARGLMSEPEILFMDEPTRSLDPISAVAIREFVAEHIVGELGSTVILATHSMPEAEALCRRLAFIQDGRIVAEGSVAELRQAIGYGIRCELRLARDAGTAGVELARLPGVLAVLPAAVPIAPSAQGGEPADAGPLVVRLTLAEEGVLAGILRALVSAGADVVGCETHDLSLEEIYVHTLTSGTMTAPRLVSQAVAR
jgi:ABC-2 type transport system ATP-binding protein